MSRGEASSRQGSRSPGSTFAGRCDFGPSVSGTLPTIAAVEIIRRMRGGSQPFLMRCDDGGNYVVKFTNNPQHVRILANELLASRLAALAGLPVPPQARVEVSPGLVSGGALLNFQVGSRQEPCASGLQFGSRFPGNPAQTLVIDFLPDRLLRRVHNLNSIFAGAFVLDKWTCNCDGRQVIFHRSLERQDRGYSAALIDHGFCFNDGEWNFPDSPIRGIYPRRLVYENVRGLQSFEPFLSRIENMEAPDLEDAVREIPGGWYAGEAEQLNHLAERLFERRRRIRQLIIDAKNSSLQPFVNWR